MHSTHSFPLSPPLSLLRPPVLLLLENIPGLSPPWADFIFVFCWSRKPPQIWQIRADSKPPDFWEMPKNHRGFEAEHGKIVPAKDFRTTDAVRYVSSVFCSRWISIDHWWVTWISRCSEILPFCWAIFCWPAFPHETQPSTNDFFSAGHGIFVFPVFGGDHLWTQLNTFYLAVLSLRWCCDAGGPNSNQLYEGEDAGFPTFRLWNVNLKKRNTSNKQKKIT